MGQTTFARMNMWGVLSLGRAFSRTNLFSFVGCLLSRENSFILSLLVFFAGGPVDVVTGEGWREG